MQMSVYTHCKCLQENKMTTYLDRPLALCRLNLTRVISVGWFAISLGAAAQDISSTEVTYRKEFSDCMDKSAGVTVALRACTSRELQHQDQRLNRIYHKLYQATPSAIKANLKAAQLAWIQFRDKQCALNGSTAQGGTLAPLLVDSCHLEMTVERANELEKLAKQL
jgi:uncharacterized protein YecT (DUF1311 family)